MSENNGTPKLLPTLAQITNRFLDKVIDEEQDDVFLTGIGSLDRSVGGIRRGDMAVIGGRPSHGKTMLGLQWLSAVAANGTTCLLISEEMGEDSLALRCLASICGSTRKDITRESYGDLWEEVAKFWTGRAPVYVACSLGSIAAVVATVQDMATYRNVGFVVVDYLQLLRGAGMTRYEQVTDVSSSLKRVAVQANVGMVALAQLGRGMEARDNTPQLRDLKDSGQIEQDADQVLFVRWPLKQDPAHRPYNEYRIYCEKNRNGAINERIVELRIVPSRQVLTEIPVEDRPNYSSDLREFNEDF